MSLHTINGSGDGSEHGKSEGLLIGSIQWPTDVTTDGKNDYSSLVDLL